MGVKLLPWKWFAYFHGRGFTSIELYILLPWNTRKTSVAGDGGGFHPLLTTEAPTTTSCVEIFNSFHKNPHRFPLLYVHQLPYASSLPCKKISKKTFTYMDVVSLPSEYIVVTSREMVSIRWK